MKYYIKCTNNYISLRGWHTTPASLCIDIANNGSMQN